MFSTQDKLINIISRETQVDYQTVRLVFYAMENNVRSLLMEANNGEPSTVKLFTGLTLTGKYVPEREFHSFDDYKCKPRIKVKAKTTDYWNKIIE